MTDPFLDHPILTSRYFYPWPNTFEDPFYVTGNDFRLGCRYRHISNELPTIIHFHGNGETVEEYLGDFESRITSMEANLLLAEYRGYGMSDGMPGLVTMLDDVQLIVEAIRVPPEQIIFYGRSLGSLYAAHGASLYPQAAGLIIESGLSDPLERILARIEPREVGATMEALQAAVNLHLNQRQKIETFQGRVLILHTRNDDMVHVSHAERLYEWAHEPKQILVFERGDHNTIMAANVEEYFNAVERFVAACHSAG